MLSGRIHIPARTAVNHHDLAHIVLYLGYSLLPALFAIIMIHHDDDLPAGDKGL